MHQPDDPSGWCTAARRDVLSCHGIRQTLEGSFSAVSKPNFASKYAFESSRRDLHNALLCTAPKSHFFQKISRICQNLRNFSEFAKFFAKFYANFEMTELCKGVQLVALGESFQTHIFLQNLASIQPRTSPVNWSSTVDCQETAQVDPDTETEHFAELQFALQDFLTIKDIQHEYYEVTRAGSVTEMLARPLGELGSI